MTPKHRPRPQARARAIAGALYAGILALVVLSFGASTDKRLLWVALPIVVVTVAGGLGGVAFVITDPLRRSGGWRRTAANVLSVFFYCVIVSAAFIATLTRPR
jgi:hypothetical protein